MDKRTENSTIKKTNNIIFNQTFLDNYNEDATLIELLNKINETQDVEITNQALRYASYKIYFDIVKILIDNGADVNTYSEKGMTPLLNAAKTIQSNVKEAQKQIEVCELLLKNGADINYVCQTINMNALIITSLKNNVELGRFLLHYGADINLTSSLGTAFSVAIGSGNVSFLELLIQNGIDINRTSRVFYFLDKTPLWIACSNYADNQISSDKRLKIIQLLIDNGAQVNHVDSDGDTALMELVHDDENIESVKLLLKYGSKVNLTTNNGESPLMIASSCGSEKCVELLLKHSVEVNTRSKQGKTSLIYACEKGSSEVVKLLLEHGAKVNVERRRHQDSDFYKMSFFIKFVMFFQKESALSIAVDHNNFDIVKLLLNYGAKFSNSMMNDVISNNNVEILETAMKHGFDSSSFKYNGLGYKYFSIDVDMINCLVKYRLLNFSVIDVYNFSKNLEVAKILIPHVDDRLKMQLRHYAIQKNNTKLLNFLNDTKVMEAELDWSNKYVANLSISTEGFVSRKLKPFIQWQILKAAASYINEESELINIYTLNKMIKSNYDETKILKIFKARKELLNQQDYDGVTPLMLSCQLEKIESVNLLLKYNADIDIEDNSNKTALNYAANNKTLNLLLKKKKLQSSHRPQKLVELLTNFRKDTPIKYTTHIWDMSFKEDYGNFQAYILKVSHQWSLIEETLRELSPRLHSKIFAFLLNQEKDVESWYSKNNVNINIGWSSLSGLEEWCNNGNDPFNFKLDKPYKLNNSSISTFGEVINLFKQEIQVRNENNALENILIDIEEKLDDKYEGIFEIEMINLKGKSFYIDTEIFRDVLLNRVFKDIEKRQEFNKIIVEVLPNSVKNYHELHIVQLGSQANRSAEEMLEIVSGGDSSIIKNSLVNLCDWSIESSHEDENYRINYLNSLGYESIESLDYKPKGFTHIMRFYK